MNAHPAPMRPAPTRIALPLLVLALAAAGIAYGWQPAPAQRPTPRLEPAPTAAAALPSLPTLPALKDLTATIQRPLFEPSRRMPAAPVAAAAPAGPLVLGKYRLLGIVSAGGKRSAVLAPLEGGGSRLLAAGGMLEDWLLAEVNEGSLLLRRGAASETVRLRPPASERAK